ncbi:MAG: tRNA 2-selenouridine(34) synthase MnmH [Pseudomonadales bacterium]
MQSSNDYLSIILQDTPLLDVRAPIEHQKGTVNSALNIPLMSDNEREAVGTCYKEQGQDAAIALGRKLVTPQLQRSRSEQWNTFCKTHPEGLLFCFRGGLRSRITQQWIAETGIDYPYVEGGYKALRRFLIDELEKNVHKIPMTLISGRTGSGKTRLLSELDHSIDLEGLANHRGSSFGAAVAEQPSQINFENAVSSALLKQLHTHSNTVHLEDEGRLIGSLSMPIALRDKMITLPRITLETPMQQRVQFAVEDYILDLLAQLEKQHPEDEAFAALGERHRNSLFRIRKRMGPERYTQACELLESGLKQHRDQNSTAGYHAFIELLLAQYYDPMYDYQMSKRQGKSEFSGDWQAVIDYTKAQICNR